MADERLKLMIQGLLGKGKLDIERDKLGLDEARFGEEQSVQKNLYKQNLLNQYADVKAKRDKELNRNTLIDRAKKNKDSTVIEELLGRIGLRDVGQAAAGLISPYDEETGKPGAAYGYLRSRAAQVSPGLSQTIETDLANRVKAAQDKRKRGLEMSDFIKKETAKKQIADVFKEPKTEKPVYKVGYNPQSGKYEYVDLNTKTFTGIEAEPDKTEQKEIDKNKSADTAEQVEAKLTNYNLQSVMTVKDVAGGNWLDRAVGSPGAPTIKTITLADDPVRFKPVVMDYIKKLRATRNAIGKADDLTSSDKNRLQSMIDKKINEGQKELKRANKLIAEIE